MKYSDSCHAGATRLTDSHVAQEELIGLKCGDNTVELLQSSQKPINLENAFPVCVVL